MKEKITLEAGHMFLQYGVRSVTMDDIASHLSVSKKTLYQFFEDKDDLVTQAINYHIENDKKEFEAIGAESSNSIEEFYLVTQCVRKMVDGINPSVLFDLKKYHPNAYGLFLDYKEDFIYNMIINNLEKGIKEGYFREDLKPTILARLRVEEIEMCFDPKIFPRNQFEFKEVQYQLLDHFLYGIMTEKGRALFEDYQTNKVDHEAS